jgi:anti-anti-sigma factor
VELTNSEKNGYEVIEFDGSLDTASSPAAEKEINALIDNGTLKFVFNFEKTKYMSSSCLRVLLATAKKLKGKGELKISNLNEVIEEVFDVSGFSSILNVYKTEEEALS